MALTVVNWNVEWATPRSARSPEILARIAEHQPDIVCLTETHLGLLSQWDGHAISARPDWHQFNKNARRKVLLWSSQPWKIVDDFGSDTLPPGRFVRGTTETSLGPTTVIGVCIPYHNANVNFGAKTSSPWQDHMRYLDGLAAILKKTPRERLVVTGDFNQQIGQSRRPYPPLSHPVRTALKAAMQSGRAMQLTLATSGLGRRGRRAIDQIAISGDLCAESLATIDNLADDGSKLSDHFGVVANLSSHH